MMCLIHEWSRLSKTTSVCHSCGATVDEPQPKPWFEEPWFARKTKKTREVEIIHLRRRPASQSAR